MAHGLCLVAAQEEAMQQVGLEIPKPLSSTGDFDIQEVIKSEYFFC